MKKILCGLDSLNIKAWNLCLFKMYEILTIIVEEEYQCKRSYFQLGSIMVLSFLSRVCLC